MKNLKASSRTKLENLCFPLHAVEKKKLHYHTNVSFHISSKKVNDYEQVLVTPHVNLDLTQTQLNEENEDFSSRRRYHQTLNIQGQLIDT